MAGIKTIRSLRNTFVSGKFLQGQQTYSVPGDVSEKDARTLIQLGKAVEIIDVAGAAKASPKKEKDA